VPRDSLFSKTKLDPPLGELVLLFGGITVVVVAALLNWLPLAGVGLLLTVAALVQQDRRFHRGERR
jgi:hypothetical protein